MIQLTDRQYKRVLQGLGLGLLVAVLGMAFGPLVVEVVSIFLATILSGSLVTMILLGDFR